MRVLSGGENAKVRLCKLMQNKYNVLVLDEPTNHLDIYAKGRVEPLPYVSSKEPSFW